MVGGRAAAGLLAVALTAAASHAQPVDPGPHFAALGLTGSILVCEAESGTCHEHNSARNRVGFLPASTFKIPNSLIALETGVVADEHEVFPWDGVERWLPAWSQDLDLRRAFAVSGVWFYQEVARRVGAAAMRDWLERLDYGNRLTGPEVDMFWLNGDLRITPREQVAFLRRLRESELPVSERTMAITREIMINDRGDGWVLRGKTGMTDAPDPAIGWYVGYLEEDGRVYDFATSIDIVTDDDVPARIEVTRRSLRALGLLDPP